MSTKKKIILGVVVVAVLAVLGGYGYILFIKEDAPAELTTTDLDAALDATTTVAATDAPADTTASGDTTAPADTAAAPADTAAPASDGTRGRRERPVGHLEHLHRFGPRLPRVGGARRRRHRGAPDERAPSPAHSHIDGATATAAEFTVDMTTFVSDSSRRDGQFDTRIMTVDQFPTSTFVLTSPIDFGSVPAVGESITATATGDLTLRGVTNSVTFELTAKLENGRIGVLGNIPILFSDYQIPDPSNGFATVKDNGLSRVRPGVRPRLSRRGPTRVAARDSVTGVQPALGCDLLPGGRQGRVTSTEGDEFVVGAELDELGVGR